MLLNAWKWLIEQFPTILHVLIVLGMDFYRVMPPILHLQLILSLQYFVFHIKTLPSVETSHGTLFRLEQLHHKLLQAIDAIQLQISSH